STIVSRLKGFMSSGYPRPRAAQRGTCVMPARLGARVAREPARTREPAEEALSRRQLDVERGGRDVRAEHQLDALAAAALERIGERLARAREPIAARLVAGGERHHIGVLASGPRD